MFGLFARELFELPRQLGLVETLARELLLTLEHLILPPRELRNPAAIARLDGLLRKELCTDAKGACATRDELRSVDLIDPA